MAEVDYEDDFGDIDEMSDVGRSQGDDVMGSSSAMMSVRGAEEEDEGDEEVTPSEVLSQMKVAWQSEAAAPTLLPHRFELLELLIEMIEGMEENLSRIKDKVCVKVSVHRLELQRIGFLCNHYTRTRLHKIESNPRRMLANHNERAVKGKADLLAPSEIEFCTRLASSESALLAKAFLQRLPASLHKIPVPREDLRHERVLIEVLSEDCEDVNVPDPTDPASEIVIGLDKGTVHLIPYLAISELLETGKIRLL